MRNEAEMLLKQYPLKAADALQLAAAKVWCSGATAECMLLSGDAQLLDAAQKLGFGAIPVR